MNAVSIPKKTFHVFVVGCALLTGLLFPVLQSPRSGNRRLASLQNLTPAILAVGGELGSRSDMRGLPFYDDKQQVMHVLIERKSLSGQWKVFERWIVDGDSIQVLRASN